MTDEQLKDIEEKRRHDLDVQALVVEVRRLQRWKATVERCIHNEDWMNVDAIREALLAGETVVGPVVDGEQVSATLADWSGAASAGEPGCRHSLVDLPLHASRRLEIPLPPL